MLLPGALVAGPSARRSLRDWIVDAVIYTVALGAGALALAATWEEHSRLFVAIDILIGLAAVGALWFRRSHPRGVAAFVLPAAALSGLAGGAAIIVIFNAALRCNR